MSTAPLILASGSRYRAELLARLGIPFTQHSPDLDESAHLNEDGLALATRLARQKAEQIAQLHPGAWVIGSDQVAICESRLIGKPGNRERAIEQLQFMSGKTCEFVTGVLLTRHDSEGFSGLDRTQVRFRTLSAAAITHYVDTEPSFDCAGSAKIEGLGISLMSEVRSSDPTGLIGLPLIVTAELLRRAGYWLL